MSTCRLFVCNTFSKYSSILSLRSSTTIQTHQAPISTKASEKLGLPLPPKKPLSPYLKFVVKTRPEIVQKQPTLKPKEVFKLIAKEWSEYDSDKKKIMSNEFRLELDSYMTNMEQYKQNLSVEQLELIQAQKNKKRRSKEASRLTEKKENLGRPKKPATAFLRFMMEKRATKAENQKYSIWLKEVAKEWENMSENMKEKYTNATKEDMVRYHKEIMTWEEDMVRQGHIDVIRYKGLFDKKSIKKLQA